MAQTSNQAIVKYYLFTLLRTYTTFTVNFLYLHDWERIRLIRRLIKDQIISLIRNKRHYFLNTQCFLHKKNYILYYRYIHLLIIGKVQCHIPMITLNWYSECILSWMAAHLVGRFFIPFKVVKKILNNEQQSISVKIWHILLIFIPKLL